jgi:hypothetical protein
MSLLQPGKSVMLKTLFLNKPYSAKVIEVDQYGVWVEAVDMTGMIQREAAGTGSAAIPQGGQFLSGYPLLYVPFSQIQWMGGQKSQAHTSSQIHGGSFGRSPSV